MGLHYYPFIFMMVSSSLKNIDSQIEEASELLGASRWRTLRLITFPAVLPALLSALLLAFSRTIGTYGTPALLGAPTGFTVLPVQIRSFLKMNLAAQAHILALFMIIISVVLLFINERNVGSRKSFSLIGGKGFKTRLTNLGAFRFWFSFGALAFLFVFVIAPLLLLVWSSFMSSAGSYSLDNFTLHYWIGKSDPGLASAEPGLFRNPKVWISTINSLRLSFLGGLICATLGMFIGYAVVKGRGQKISKLLERVSFIPMLVPSIAFGAIYLSLFSRQLGPIPALYGTFTLLVLLVVGKQLPFSTRSGISAMHQIGSELEEAAEISGASWAKRYRQIIWPLTRTGFVSGLLIVFVTTMRELSLFILLISPRTQVLTTLTFSFSEIGVQQLSNALMSFLVIIVFVVTFLIKLYEKLTQKNR
jgi:iron(III) transport system permease protein